MSQTKDALIQASNALIAAANHIEEIEVTYQNRIDNLENKIAKNEKFMYSLKELLNDYYSEY